MASESPNQRTVEFYLSSLWSWALEGRNRVLDALESCDLDKANFVWDNKRHWFQIRCLAADKKYVLKEYLRAQTEMENELKEQGVIQDNGSLIPTAKNVLVRTSRPRSTVVTNERRGFVEDIKGTGHIASKRVNGKVHVGREKPKAASEDEDYCF
ncbi:hypothetical protein Daus18300_005840 [Diaporthe australafricana]|uniref:Uncharacterized protein n=1 Tax=Diaporthe australafricana TaxID=127596 RepID=A0ABR3WZ27_9PEZI